MEEKKPILPGPYPIKIVINNEETVLQAVLQIVNSHFPKLDNNQIKYKHSKDDHYISMTVTPYVKTEEQLKKLNRSLKELTGVIMIL